MAEPKVALTVNAKAARMDTQWVMQWDLHWVVRKAPKKEESWDDCLVSRWALPMALHWAH